MSDWKALLAGLIDHTLLKPEATRADAKKIVEEGGELGTYSVCLSPSMLPMEVAATKLAVVCGFPSGKHTAATKAAEAKESVTLGADEVDMVIDLGLAKVGDFDAVRREIALVKAEVPAPRVLKVIIESAALTDAEIVGCCRAAVDAGADFVKTSTGFHPAGGASEHAVQLMRKNVGPRIGVKASGGIRTATQALNMVLAGANRLGMSSAAAALAEDLEPSVAQLAALEAARP